MIQPPPRDVARVLRLDNPVRQTQILNDTQHTGQLLVKKLRDAFIELGIELRSPATEGGISESLLPSGAASPIDTNGSESFVLQSSISPRTGDFFEVNLQLASLDREQPVDSLSFRLKTEQERREVVYHEAGHVSMHWLFGTLSDLAYIDIRGSGYFPAVVVSRGIDAIDMIEGCDRRDKQALGLVEIKARQSVMYHLAGFAAEDRVKYVPPGGAEIRVTMNKLIVQSEGGSELPLWFADLLYGDPNELLAEDDYDFMRAVNTAKALYGETEESQRFLREMAQWTDEALSHPRLWAVVESLAERLQTITTKLSAQSAIKIMSDAWGDRSGVPYEQMGQKWQRRFRLGVS